MAKKKPVRSLAALVSGVPFTAYCDMCGNSMDSRKVPAFCTHCGGELHTVNDLENHVSFHPHISIPESYQEFYKEAFDKAPA